MSTLFFCWNRIEINIFSNKIPSEIDCAITLSLFHQSVILKKDLCERDSSQTPTENNFYLHSTTFSLECMLQPFLSSQKLRKRTETLSIRTYRQENKCFCMCITITAAHTYSITCSAEPPVLPECTTFTCWTIKLSDAHWMRKRIHRD